MLSPVNEPSKNPTYETLGQGLLGISKNEHPSPEQHPSDLKQQELQIRKQAAVMFTDIVGYTDMIEDDEEKTLQLLIANRHIQKQFIEQQGGNWIKEMGDGILSSFNTASSAVNCALDIQKEVQEVAGFSLRIGIHLSQVVFMGDDVFGLGVNIASRIQEIASPGQIWVSGSVAKTVKFEKDICLRFIRRHLLKNVKRPVRIYEASGALEEMEKIIVPPNVTLSRLTKG